VTGVQTCALPIYIQSPQSNQLVLKVMDNILPTWKIKCEMCEFDLEDIGFNALSSLSVGTDPEQASITFKIKVGNIKEAQIYPMFQCMFLDDITLNNSKRTSTTGANNSPVNNTAPTNLTNNSFPANDNRGYPSNLQIAQSQFQELDTHISGLPFLERANENNLTAQSPEPNTWIGNAATFGKAFVSNMVKSTVTKAEMTPIYGISYTELNSAIQSKDIIVALGLLKKASDTISQSMVAPSSRLNGPISDGIFKSFLSGIANSEATSGNEELINMTKQILNSNHSTINMVINVANNFKNIVNEETKGSLSFATTVEKVSNVGKVQIDSLSKATSSKLVI
jgi:hypothetical protein